jgi:hypothetical protein
MNLLTIVRRSLCLTAILGAGHIALADKPGANAVQCLNRENIRSTRVLDGRNIVFITRDRTNYANQLPKLCSGLHRGIPLAFTYSDHKLCAGSTFTVLLRAGASTNHEAFTDPVTNQHISLDAPAFVPGASCQLSIFNPISDDELKGLVAATGAQNKARRRGERDTVKTEPVPPALPAARPPAP